MRTIILATLLVLAGTPADAKTWSESGTLVVLNKHEASAWLIDLSTGDVKRKLETGVGPHEGAASPGGKLVAVANYGRKDAGSSLTLIDISKGEVAATVSLGELRRPHGLAWLDDARIAVTVEDNEALAIVNVKSGKVEKTIKTDQKVSHMVAVSDDKKQAFVANIGSGSLSVLDLESGKAVKTVTVDKGTEGVAIRPGGKEIWVTNTKADTLSIINAKDHKVSRTMPAGDFPIRVQFTTDGSHALVASLNTDQLLVYDADGQKVKSRVQFEKESYPIGVLPHPGGKLVYVANSGADHVAVVDAKTWRVVGKIATGKVPDGMAYTPVQLK